MGVIVRTLPFIAVLIGIDVPALFFNSICIVPANIGSLNVVVIIVSIGTFIAFLAGLPAVGVGTNRVLGAKFATINP